MPYEHYAKNPQTGEYVGWNGTEWVSVQPREVPGTVAYDALQRQPGMRAAERRMQKDARPSTFNRLASIAKGTWDTTGAAAGQMGEQMNQYQRENPVKSLAFPFLPAAATMTEGMVEGVKARGADMGTAIDEGNYLRAAGDAIAIGTAPVGGTAFADIADTIKDDPYRALGQGLGVAATFGAPAAVRGGMNATGPIGRSMQRAGARQGARAVGATRLPEMDALVQVDKAGKPRGPVVNVLESDSGLPISRSQGSLYDNLHELAGREGERVGAVKSTLQRGDYVLDQAVVDNTIFKAIDDEMAKYAEVDAMTGKPRVDPATGRLMGSTVDGDKIIRNLENVKKDILRSADPKTGQIDVTDLFSKRDTWNDVYNKLKNGQQGKDLAPTTPAHARKVGADILARTINEQIPELAGPNRAFSSAATLRDELKGRMKPDEGVIGNIGKVLGPQAARGFTYAFAVAGSGPFAVAAQVGVAADLLYKTFTSTAWRTLSANQLYRIGKFLEAGELASAAAEIAPSAAPGAAAASSGTGGTGGRPTSPSPTAAASSGAGGGSATTLALGDGTARRMPLLETSDPYAPGPIIEGEIIPPSIPPTPPATAGRANSARALPSASQSRLLPPAPIDELANGGGMRLRGPVNFGDSGPAPARPQQTITPTPMGVTPRSPAPRRLTPYEEVSRLFDKRNALIADEAGKAVEAGNANAVLKEVAASRASTKPETAPAPTPTPTPRVPVKGAAKIDSSAAILDQPSRSVPIPKRLPKPEQAPTPTAAPDYATMDTATLQQQLRNAERVRDNAKKMSAGSNMFRQAQSRVDAIQNALQAQNQVTPNKVFESRADEKDRTEFADPKTKRHENEDLVRSTPFWQLLPERFKTARSVRGASDTTGWIEETGANARWNVEWNDDKGTAPRLPTIENFAKDAIGDDDELIPGKFNNILTTPEASNDHFVILHEYGHPLYEKDLTPAERDEWETMYANWEKNTRTLQQQLRSKHGVDAFQERINNMPVGPGRTRAVQEISDLQKRIDAEVEKRVPAPAAVRNRSAYEAYPSLVASYVLDPSRFKQKYPEWYAIFRKHFGGREYIRQNQSDGQKSKPQQPATSAAPSKPKRISANRNGRKIEGVLVRSFVSPTRGDAMILRADDGSERLVFKSEISSGNRTNNA